MSLRRDRAQREGSIERAVCRIAAVHFASAMLLFGSLVFVSTVAEPVWRKRDRASPDERNILHRWLFAVALWCVIASIVSGVLWLAEGPRS
jgi:hypothetical protein